MFSSENFAKKAVAFLNHQQKLKSPQQPEFEGEKPTKVSKEFDHNSLREQNVPLKTENLVEKDDLLKKQRTRRRLSYIFAVDNESLNERRWDVVQTPPTNPKKQEPTKTDDPTFRSATTMTSVDIKRGKYSKEESLSSLSSLTRNGDVPSSMGESKSNDQRHRYVRSATSVSVTRLLSDGCNSLLQRLRRIPNVEKRFSTERKSTLRNKSIEKQQRLVKRYKKIKNN